MEQNINRYVHNIISNYLTKTSICLDATCGNGYDTVFLAQHAKHVYAMDIQEQAIRTTRANLRKHKLTNVTVNQTSHDLLLSLFPDIQFDVIMYNLGYLPYSDHHIKTNSVTTTTSLQQAIQLIKQKGIIAITLYIGHDGGLEEAQAVETYVKNLDKKQFTVLKSSYLNREQAPYLILIQKQ